MNETRAGKYIQHSEDCRANWFLGAEANEWDLFYFYYYDYFKFPVQLILCWVCIYL